MTYRPVDVDSHVQEKRDCWTSRMSESRWGDRIPHYIEMPDGQEVFLLDGKSTPIGQVLQCHSVMPDRETLPARWDEVPKSVHFARERLKAMDQDGVEIEVLYPNAAGPSGSHFQGKDADYEAECVRAFNDMAVDEWLAVSNRFVPLCLLPYSSMDRTVAELRYAVERGHLGPVVFSTPHERGLPHFNDRYWDPLWASAQDLNVPINFHGLGGSNKMRWASMQGTSYRRARALSGGGGYGLQAQCFSNLLFSGVLDRFPRLVFVCAESGLGWVPYVLEACDYAWERSGLRSQGQSKPSELFKRQIYVDFWYEKAAFHLLDYMGPDRIMWESDFPHPTSLWPNSMKTIEWTLEGVPEADRRLILVENGRKVYHR